MLKEVTLPAISENVESGEVIASSGFGGGRGGEGPAGGRAGDGEGGVRGPLAASGARSRRSTSSRARRSRSGEVLARLETDASRPRGSRSAKPRAEQQAAPPPAKAERAAGPPGGGPAAQSLPLKSDRQPVAAGRAAEVRRAGRGGALRSPVGPRAWEWISTRCPAGPGRTDHAGGRQAVRSRPDPWCSGAGPGVRAAGRPPWRRLDRFRTLPSGATSSGSP